MFGEIEVWGFAAAKFVVFCPNAPRCCSAAVFAEINSTEGTAENEWRKRE